MSSNRSLSKFESPFRFLERFPFFDEGEDFPMTSASGTGLTISEDEQHIFVQAHLPGLSEDQIDVTFENGIVWIQGQQKEQTEDKNKKFYKRAISSFSYRFPLPGDFDETKEPSAELKKGVLHLTFPKSKKAQPRKINIAKK